MGLAWGTWRERKEERRVRMSVSLYMSIWLWSSIIRESISFDWEIERKSYVPENQFWYSNRITKFTSLIYFYEDFLGRTQLISLMLGLRVYLDKDIHICNRNHWRKISIFFIVSKYYQVLLRIIIPLRCLVSMSLLIWVLSTISSIIFYHIKILQSVFSKLCCKSDSIMNQF